MKPKLCKTLIVTEDCHAKLKELKGAWLLDSASETIQHMYKKLQDQAVEIGALRAEAGKR